MSSLEVGANVPSPDKAAASTVDVFQQAVQPLTWAARHHALAVLDEADAEAVHALRGGLRRLRATLSLFRSDLDGGEGLSRVRRELHWLIRGFGRVRDLDVLAARLSRDDDHPNCNADEILLCAASQARRQAAARAVACLGGLRAGVLLNGLADTWLAEGRRAHIGREGPLASLARQDIRLRRAGPHIERLGREARHKLRERIKTLRYGAESVSFLGHVPEDYMTALVSLHHILGEWNDIVVGVRLAQRLAPALSSPPRGMRPDDADDLRRRLAAAWVAFNALPSPWAEA